MLEWVFAHNYCGRLGSGFVLLLPFSGSTGLNRKALLATGHQDTCIRWTNSWSTRACSVAAVLFRSSVGRRSMVGTR